MKVCLVYCDNNLFGERTLTQKAGKLYIFSLGSLLPVYSTNHCGSKAGGNKYSRGKAQRQDQRDPTKLDPLSSTVECGPLCLSFPAFLAWSPTYPS